jgi:hypothetical protein
VIVEELFAKLGIDVDESGLSRAAAAIGSLRTGMLALGGAAAGLGVALVAMVKATADHAGKVQDLSDSTGANVEVLQRLGYAASLSGVSMEALAKGMQFAAKHGAKDVEKHFGDVAEQVKALTDKGRGPEAAALAMQKFGRSGAQLVGVLKKGRDGIAELSARADALGIVLNPETISLGDDLGDEIDTATYALKGLAYTIAGPLLGPIREVVTLFVTWVATNRKMIAAKVHQSLELMGRAFKQIWKLAQPFIALFKFLITNTWALRAAAIALALVLLGQVGAALSAFAAGLSLVNAGLLAMIANQIRASAIGLLWVATLAALVLIIEDVYGFFTGKDSLVGRWSEWVSQLTDNPFENADDFWVVKILKNMLRYITNIQAAWMDFQNFLGRIPGFAKKAASFVVGSPAYEIGGGAVSPEMSVQERSDVLVRALGNVSITQTIAPTQPADMTGPEFAKAVADQSSENFQKELSQAAWGVQW